MKKTFMSVHNNYYHLTQIQNKNKPIHTLHRGAGVELQAFFLATCTVNFCLYCYRNFHKMKKIRLKINFSIFLKLKGT